MLSKEKEKTNSTGTHAGKWAWPTRVSHRLLRGTMPLLLAGSKGCTECWLCTLTLRGIGQIKSMFHIELETRYEYIVRDPSKTFGLNVCAVMLSPLVVAKMDVFQYTMSTGRKLEANLGTSECGWYSHTCQGGSGWKE